MQFTDEVDWAVSDFLAMGILLFCASLLGEIVVRKVVRKQNKILLLLLIITTCILIWIELAVGTHGSW